MFWENVFFQKVKKIFLFSFFVSFFFIIPILGISKEKNIQVGFSPGKSAINLLLDVINSSKKNINIAAYSFTSKPISQALVKAKERGVLIRVIADKKSNSGKYTAVNYLANHGILVRLNGKYPIMHNKFMIIDDCIVETGSFNYTKNAAYRNAENLLVIRKKRIASKYNREFDRLWKESKLVLNRY